MSKRGGNIMDLGVKLQELRKTKGISQQELADKLNVSRQSVSKWELNDSVPEISKIVLISEIYSISLDHLLRETDETTSSSERKNEAKVLFVVSTFLIVIGLLLAIGGWDQEKYLESIAGGLIIQMVGLAVLLIGKAISPSEKFPIKLKVANYIFLAFMPMSILTNMLKGNSICPYPRNSQVLLLFLSIYIAVIVIGLVIIKKNRK